MLSVIWLCFPGTRDIRCFRAKLYFTSWCLIFNHFNNKIVSMQRTIHAALDQPLGKPGKCPGPRAWISKHSFTGFSYFYAVHHALSRRDFLLLRVVYRSGKLITLAFIVFDWLQRIEPNSTALHDPRIRSKPVHPMNVCRNFSRVGQRQVLLILYRLLMMQCKWSFTKRFTLSNALVCAGWTSILNRLSETFSTLLLSEMLFFW